MAKVQCPTVAILRPEPNKTLEQNLEEMFRYIVNMASQSPEDFQLSITVPLHEMPLEEMQKLVDQAQEDAVAQEKRELVSEGLTPEGKMTYTLKD